MAMNEDPLTSAIRDVLFKHWDPIGFGELLPSDEYDRYIPPLADLIYNGAAGEPLYQTLKSFDAYFGIQTPEEKIKNTVEALQRLYSKNS
jgi:hypothetical protein